MPRTSAAMRGQHNNEEHTEILDGGPVQDVDVNSIGSEDGTVAGSAVDDVDLSDSGPPVQRFLVVKGGHAQTQLNGQRARLVEGKTIDSLNYDIELLRKQGVKLEPVVDDATA